jgi:hypothetical protein
MDATGRESEPKKRLNVSDAGYVGTRREEARSASLRALF